MLDESALKQGSLIVVGNINRDVKTSPIPGGSGLLSDGETAAESITETIGGGGANGAFAAAALGGRVAFMGKVGDDDLAARLQTRLEKSGIDARLSRDPKNPTGTSLALTYDSGHRHFVSCLPSSRTLAFEDLDLNLAGYRHLLRADIWFSEPMLFGGNAKLFEWARSLGVSVSIDLNWDPLWGHGSEAEIVRRKQAVMDVMPCVTMAHGNVRELCACTQTDDLEAAIRKLESCGAGSVLVHMGDKGAGFYQKGKLEVVPPVPAARRVHATGTGDVLSVCTMLLHDCGAPMCERLFLANRIVSEFIEGKRTLIPAL